MLFAAFKASFMFFSGKQMEKHLSTSLLVSSVLPEDYLLIRVYKEKNDLEL